MVITYYGAACFKVQSGDFVLAFNPPAKESEYKSPRFGADVVFVSKNDKDYNGWENLAKKGDESAKTLLIDGKGEYETRGIHIKGIGSNGGKINTVYALSLEDINICHLGAFGEKDIDPKLKADVGEVDILFLPIGGSGALDPQKAAGIAAHIEPKIVIPMHYKEVQLKQFLKEFGSEGVKPADKLTIKRKDLADKKTEVVVLEPAV
ncbi:MAG: MBL fold metallo-hydrolase [Candidatus Pacebacteria bacterium]|nr:MBL fold metallo-hydrolase [Candidatus Paceibacterota bacterium]